MRFDQLGLSASVPPWTPRFEALNAASGTKNSALLNRYYVDKQCDEDLVVPSKEYPLGAQVILPPLVGLPTVRGSGGRGYPLPSDAYSAHNLGGWVSRFTGHAGNNLFLLPCTGASFERIEFRGVPYVTDGGPTGTIPETLIELQGRKYPATGYLTLDRCGFMYAKVAIRCSIGPKWLPECPNGDENHADNNYYGRCIFSNVGTCLQLENQQSVVHELHGCSFLQHGLIKPMTIAKVMRGGNVHLTGCSSLNHSQLTMFDVYDFSPNTCALDCDNFRWDTFEPGARLTIFKYSGPMNDSLWRKKWRVRVKGHIANEHYDMSKLIDVPEGFPIKNIQLDIDNGS